MLLFGGYNGRVRRGAAALAADQHVQSQLAALVQENSELRRMYKHMETQLTFAAEELSGTSIGSPLDARTRKLSAARPPLPLVLAPSDER